MSEAQRALPSGLLPGALPLDPSQGAALTTRQGRCPWTLRRAFGPLDSLFGGEVRAGSIAGVTARDRRAATRSLRLAAEAAWPLTARQGRCLWTLRRAFGLRDTLWGDWFGRVPLQGARRVTDAPQRGACSGPLRRLGSLGFISSMDYCRPSRRGGRLRKPPSARWGAVFSYTISLRIRLMRP